ncbi:MAG: hypothetical protein AAGA09_03955 [Pseudomonadota bacterium]
MRGWASLFAGACAVALVACGRADTTTSPGTSPGAASAGNDASSVVSNADAAAATNDEPAQFAGPAALDATGERFVKLALGLGHHDTAFVDAYHGPAEWAASLDANPPEIDALEKDARDLLTEIKTINAASPSVRGAMQEKLAAAALMRIRMTQGETVAFDEETRVLYDAVAPGYDLADFDAALAEIDALLPGDEPLAARVEAFNAKIAIPAERLQAVFDAAIAECRRRTLAHFDLPEKERFSLEFVTDKPWSGYNWYQGDFESLIQVNTDFPIFIDRAIDLGCHEGYPGHHTWNVFLERDILGREGWIEYSVYPLFSALSLIAEGSANYGIDLAFPGEEKIAFERDVLFPLAGLDPAQAETLGRLNAARRKLSHVRNHIAREYLDGRITRDDAVRLAMRYRLETADRADQTVRFMETYRGYVLNYSLGLDLVDQYIAKRTGDDGNARWEAFRTLLTTPLAASDLEKE